MLARGTRMKRRSILILAIFLALAARPLSMAAAPVRSGPVEAELVSEQSTIQPGGSFFAAIRLSADAGWHTYWKNPGDSGLASTVTWDLPQGFSVGPLLWPIPERFETSGSVSYGYAGETFLLVEIRTPADLSPDTTVVVRAKATWLACRIECTPGSAALELALPVSAESPTIVTLWRDAFISAKARIPVPDPGIRMEARLSGKKIVLAAEPLPVSSGSRFLFIPAAAGLIADAAPQEAHIQGNRVELPLELAAGSAAPSRLQGILVETGPAAARAREVDLPVEGTGARGSASPVALLIALLFAFLGGILLNLMPCVLPVLSLKVLGFVRESQRTGRSALRHGLAFSAGVLISFWLIAGVLLALRAGGQLIGWGFQFQDPALVAVMAALFFLIGLNLLGVFEVGVSFTTLGTGSRSGGGWAGSFLSGFLATAAATPCTAPFMGSALGFALSQPALAAFGVFTALGAGMAAPYLALTASPGLLARVPKPGPWMETLRNAMAFPMMGAVIWMISVLAALSGVPALVTLLAGLLVSALGAWIWGRGGGISRSARSRIVSGTLAVILVAGSTAFAAVSARTSRALETAQEDASWEQWSPGRVEELRAAGTPVFIDFTAKWCLTCQVNEAVALRNPGVLRRFRELGVALLKADWTDSDDTIARAIAGFGRAGVPVYVLYAPGNRDPVLLPEILTPGILKEALSRM